MSQRTMMQRERERETALASVQEVLSSSGQPLDADTQNFMGARFGHDFGQVRVHTDEKAAESTQSVNALAYTVGQDVVFGQGQYAPGTSEGKKLLAHELTHVVQQAPEPIGNTPLLKNASISEPDASYEIEADHVAQKIMNGTTPEPMHASQSHTTDSTIIFRVPEIIKAPLWGTAPTDRSDSNVWFNPHTELYINDQLVQSSWFTGPLTGETSLTASPGSSGVLHIAVDMGWFRNNMFYNDCGKANYALNIHFTITPEGVVQWQSLAPENNTEGNAAELVLPVAVASNSTTTGGSVVVSPLMRSAGSSSMNIGGNFGASVSEEVSAGISGGYSQTIPNVFAWGKSYVVNLVVPKPAMSRAHPPYTIGIPFLVDSAHIAEGEERAIVNWYSGLPPEVKKVVETGAVEITLRGHASTTQPGPANRILSERRVNKVQAILQDIAGSHARFHTYAIGEYEARTPDNVEDSNERGVDISVDLLDQQLQGTNTQSNPNH